MDSLTIVINDNGEINYDEKTLKSIIDSNQKSATVTIVRAGQDDSSTTAKNMPAAADVSENEDIDDEIEEQVEKLKLNRKSVGHRKALETALAMIHRAPTPAKVGKPLQENGDFTKKKFIIFV